MNNDKLIIEKAWEQLESLSAYELQQLKDVIEHVLDLCDKGAIRVSEKIEGQWVVNEWIKKAVLLYFKINTSKLMSCNVLEGDERSCWYDKVDLKFARWNEQQFQQSKIRAVPGSVVRRSAYIAQNVVIMPSFINMCAYIDEGTMIDSWVTIGSGAQIGKKCHISGGVGIGGVLEPLQSRPVIIEDNCFIGARSEVAEGVIIREGAVLAMGVYIGSSTKIIDRSTGIIYKGEVPERSVVVPGSYLSTSSANNNISLYCAVIVKRVDSQTISKTSINEILRDLDV